MGAPLKKQEEVRREKGCVSEFGDGVEELGTEKARGHNSNFAGARSGDVGGGCLLVDARDLSRR